VSHRPAQIAGVIRSTVAEFALQIPPNVANVVSIVDVKMSPDFSYADVFISAMDGVDAAVKNLASRQGEIKKNLSTKLRVFKLPILRFQRDIEGERGTRLDALLEKLERESAEKGTRTAPPAKKPRKKRT
jgi:ribosome-binding factor A